MILKKEVYISIRYSASKQRHKSTFEDLRNFFKNDISNNEIRLSVEQNLKKFKSEITDLTHSISRDFSLRPLGPEDIISFYQGYFYSSEDNPIVPSDTYINEQIIVPKIEEVSDLRGIIKANEREIKTFYFDQLAPEYYFGQFRVFLEEIPLESYDLSWNVSHGSSEFGSDLIAKEGWYSRKPSKQKEVRELASFREKIDSTRPHVNQSIRIMAYDLQDEEEGQLQSICMDYTGSRLVKEVQIPIHMFASSMPMNCLAIQNKVKGGRYKKIRLENALSFAPVYSGPSKVDGVRNWISRGNNLTSFDLFNGQGNKMTSVLAMSRAGKSVFNANLILEFMGRNPNGIVRVIDKKSSYQKLGDLVGGRVVNFSESSLKENTYSPFALDTWDADDIENIFLLISTALIQKNKGITLSACHTEVLRESIKLAYNNHLKNDQNAKKHNIDIDPHPVWNDIVSQFPQVCENLRASGVVGADEARDDIAKWSVNLYPTGQYGYIFSKHENLKQEGSKERFLTYDLDGIYDDVLRQLAAMMAFIKIGRDLAKLPRKTPKLIIFEELGMLLHGEDESQKLMDEFIHMVIKTCAKLNAQAIAITNDVKDYTEKAAGRTVWDNSTQKLFLPLGDLIDSAKKSWKDKYNEADFQILSSLKKEFHFKRSQAYIYSNNEVSPYKGTILIPLSPFMDALCTTSGPQVDLYNSLREKEIDCMSTLIKMAEKYPYGENIQ